MVKFSDLLVDKALAGIHSATSLIFYDVIYHLQLCNIDIRWCNVIFTTNGCSKIVNEYDQEIPQSQTADNPVAPRGRAAQPSRDTRKTN